MLMVAFVRSRDELRRFMRRLPCGLSEIRVSVHIAYATRPWFKLQESCPSAGASMHHVIITPLHDTSNSNPKPELMHLPNF